MDQDAVAISNTSSAGADTPVTPSFLVSESSELDQLQVSLRNYLDCHPDVHCLVAASMVFHNDRVLLVQRSPQEQAFAHFWEIPGGSCDHQDTTVLHSAARELFEETGLRVLRFNHQIGEGLRFETGSCDQQRQWLKLVFDVDVEEAVGTVTQQQLDEHIKLDPMEHQQWLWATEDEVWSSRVGEIDLKFISPEQRTVILDGFTRRK
jgi:8-oxo-dGTP pyrophosphatase MutT (NUDIX family)